MTDKKQTKKKKKKKKDLSEPPPKQKDLKRSREQSMFGLRRKVRYFYDLQRLRLQTQGRITKKAKDAAIQLHKGDLYVLELRLEELHQAEKRALKDVKEHLETIPYYNEILSDKSRFKGIGPTMSGVILSEFDIYRQETASQMWSFAGLKPIPAIRCKDTHQLVVPIDDVNQKLLDGGAPLKDVTFKYSGKTPKKKAKTFSGKLVYNSGKAMRPTRGEKLKYNAFLRSKLCGVLGAVLLQLNSPWRKHYDDYKQRKISAGWGTSDQHRHMASIRYMIKMLLLEIHKTWREHEGLPVRPSYQEEYLGHTHKAKGNGKSNGASLPTSDTPSSSASYESEIQAEVQQQL